MRRVVTIGLLATLATGGVAAGAERLERRPPGPEGRVARKVWALARMDEMANERLRCPERFAKRRDVEACEADFTRRFRQYNELYLEAARE